jgi:Carboxypeptidase regulatory-like domain
MNRWLEGAHRWSAGLAAGRGPAMLLALALCACNLGGSGDCTLQPNEPCPFPFAVHLTVTSATDGGPVANASIVVTLNGTRVSGECNTDSATTCEVPGGAGEYDVTVSAPGYRPVERVVDVTATPAQGCGCESVKVQTLTVALSPTT